MVCVHDFRLGQRVYTVAGNGQIQVDLISVIKLVDKKDNDVFRRNLSGHMNPVHWWSYGTLHGCKDCFVSFDEAVSKATAVIDEQLSSDKISVGDHKKLSDYKVRFAASVGWS
jgi:hypothetical protein